MNELLCTSITTQSRVLRQHGLKALCSVSRPLTESDESRDSIIARVLELVQLETDSETLTKVWVCVCVCAWVCMCVWCVFVHVIITVIVVEHFLGLPVFG